MDWYQFGVIDWIDEEKETPASSQNIGPITLDCTQQNIEDVLLIGSSSRSCYEEKLEEFETNIKAWADEKLGEGHYDLFAKNPPYSPTEINPMRDAMERGYEHAGVEWNLIDEHGGLEISAFAQSKPELYLTSIGPQLADWHSKHETLFLSSIIPTFKALAYTLTLLK
jgi:di/tripeptidase